MKLGKYSEFRWRSTRPTCWHWILPYLRVIAVGQPKLQSKVNISIEQPLYLFFVFYLVGFVEWIIHVELHWNIPNESRFRSFLKCQKMKSCDRTFCRCVISQIVVLLLSSSLWKVSSSGSCFNPIYNHEIPSLSLVRVLKALTLHELWIAFWCCNLGISMASPIPSTMSTSNSPSKWSLMEPPSGLVRLQPQVHNFKELLQRLHNQDSLLKKDWLKGMSSTFS